MARATISLLITVFLAPVPVAHTETIEVPLPELVGGYSAAGHRVAPFDLGTELDAVHLASVAWEGDVTPGRGHGDGMWIPEDEWFDWPAEFGVIMRPDHPQTGFWHAWTGLTDGAFADTTAFDAFLSPGWEFLLDGAAEVEAWLEPAIFLGGVLVVPPHGTLTASTLILEADVTDQPVDTVSWSRVKALYR
jgi:hypothetical protein